MSPEVDVLERVAGRSGELVLRRSGADLEVILNGAFLISTANEASSRAMVRPPCRTSPATPSTCSSAASAWATRSTRRWPASASRT